MTCKGTYSTFKDHYASLQICKWFYAADALLDGWYIKLNVLLFNIHKCLLLTLLPERNWMIHDAVSHKSRLSIV